MIDYRPATGLFLLNSGAHLMRFNMTSLNWAYMGGRSGDDLPGKYTSTLGLNIDDPTIYPPSRTQAGLWIDSSFNLVHMHAYVPFPCTHEEYFDNHTIIVSIWWRRISYW
jgi:hypothetical protein